MTVRPASARWFVVVGAVAALVHLGVVRVLVGTAGVAPLVANVPAWCIAFGVSYLGHRRLTFRAHDVPVGPSMLRFALVSIGALALNEAMYAVLLRFTPLRYDIALVLVIGGVALVTWWLARHWAFAGSPPAR
jgi:putative flippase GtrA